MHVPLSARIRAVFARDGGAFWWRYFTDEEKELGRMDVWQLAAVIEEAKVRPGQEKRRIVAEHMLGVRLAKIQASASWGSGVLGFAGALIGAALSVALAAMFQEHDHTASRAGTTTGEASSRSAKAAPSSPAGVGVASQAASVAPGAPSPSASTMPAVPAGKSAP